jgi:hypothetical protein
MGRAEIDRVRWGLLFLLCLSCGEGGPAASGELWPAADRIFHRDARWIGGDGAYTVDLGGDRVLWLFGDSFVATTRERTRKRSVMVRNSVAVQTGRDPSSAYLQFYWRSEDGAPRSFFADDGETYYWPEHGVRIGSSLVLFFERMVTTGKGTFDFQATAWTATVIENPDDEPSAWKMRAASLPPPNGLIAGEAVVLFEGQAYVYATKGDAHDVYVARIDPAKLAAGDLRELAWWDGEKYGGEPEAVIRDGAPEMSIHLQGGRLLCTQSEGFGSTTLALRTSARPEGPWSAPRSFFRPPESFAKGAFVYAGKGHPELVGADLIVTYVPSSFADLADEEKLYYPRFVRVRL